MDAQAVRRGVLGAALGCVALCAQSPWEALFKSMYAKFSASFDLVHDPAGTGEFMILANPGILLAPAALRDPSWISQLVDVIPRPAQLYFPSGRSLSATYWQIIRDAKVTTRGSAADLERARLASRLLWDRRRPGQPTRKYADYMRYSAEYAAAQDARTLALAENRATGKAVPPGLDRAIATALKNWEAPELGGRKAVEGALADIQKVYDANPRIQFQHLRNDYSNAEAIGLPVLASPPEGEWLKEKGWRPWRFQQSDLGQPAPRPEVPLVPAGAKVTARTGGMASLALAVELKRVAITRSWMNLAVFSAHTWRLPAGSPVAPVSTGNPADRDPGAMPLVVVGLLLARKLSVTGTWSGDAGTGRGLPASIGPFALDRPHSAGQGPEEGFSVKAEAPQIVGFIVQPVPKSPTPDPSLF